MKVKRSDTWWPITITLESRSETHQLMEALMLTDADYSIDLRFDLINALQNIIDQYEEEFK